MKTIVIYKSSLLPISETFILDQALSLQTFKPVLLGRERVGNGIDISDVEQVILNRPNKWVFRLLRLFWLPEKAVKNKIKTLNPNLLHIHFATEAVTLWPNIKNLNIPIFITLHGVDINTYKNTWKSGKKGIIGRFYPKRLLKLAKYNNVYFIAVSKAIKKRAIEFGLPEDKITVIYIGLDVNKFKPNGLPILEREKNILFTGRFVEKKAPLLLIQAFAEVVKNIPDSKLTMIGDGPLLETAKKMAKGLNINVRFLGAVTSDIVAEELGKARIFCLPSVRAKCGDAEGLPISILEGMATGIPLITSSNGAVNEAVVHNITGICFEENNLQSLVDGLESLLTNDKLVEKYSKEGLKRAVEVFDNRKTVQHLEGLYSKKFFVSQKDNLNSI